VLLYHVSPGTKTVRQLRRQHPVTTLLTDATLEVRGNRVIDGDTNDRDARIRQPLNLRASNGIIQTVDRVLRPIDLEPPAPEGPATVVDVVTGASGSEGFDANYFDYDLLREALVAAGLVDALVTAEDVTVFAPNDFAFIVLALDLGYGAVDEAGAFAFLAEATGYVSPDDPGLLDDVLRYHVLPGAKTVAELDGAGDQATLLADAMLSVQYRQIQDGDPSDVNGVIVHPNDVAAGNGIVHTTAFVLRPIDL
jgi:serralysin